MNVHAAPLAMSVGRTRMADYVGLLKLRLNVLVLVAAASGFLMAAPAEFSLVTLGAMLVGVLLSGGGASAMNMALEAHLDRLMERTKSRPVASGRVSREDALLFGALTAGLGVGIVTLASGWAASAISLATVLLYVFAYTPLKTKTPLNTLVGAIPGALPPLIGWAAGGGDLMSLAALGLFGIVFLWQFPHFLAIASMYREDYARGGFAMLPVLDPHGLRTAHRAVAYALILVPVSLVPAWCRLTGPTYFLGAAGCTLFYLVFAVRAAVLRSPSGWRDLLRASLVTLPGLFVLMVADRVSS